MDSRRMAALAAGLGLAALLAGCQDRQQGTAAQLIDEVAEPDRAERDWQRDVEPVDVQLAAV